MSSSIPLVALRTTLENRADDDVVHVYVIKVAVRLVSEFLRVLRSFSEPAAIDLQHLRRCARLNELPASLRSTLSISSEVATNSEPTPACLYILLGPVSSINLLEFQGILRKALPEIRARVHKVAVPLLAPTSPQQAKSWSSSHWPTVYKKSNPFGPHPSIISRAEEEVIKDLDTWMGMAARAAMGSKLMGYGEAVGAVIVWRRCHGPLAVVLAADGRWKGYERDGVGNPMAHAVLRAIGMLAQKLKKPEEEKDCCTRERGHPRACCEDEQEVFLDGPMLSEEQDVYMSGEVLPNGYLCHGLEIFITHEPCVACSMALIHSRFARVVFGERMPQTGGLCSEVSKGYKDGSLGHGLFWRKELNWNFLAWQTEVKDAGLHIDSVVHA